MRGIIIAMLCLGIFQMTNAQTKKVKERDLDGLWQMKIELQEGLFEQEVEEEDNAFARLILQATGNLVDGILDEINIKMEFQSNGKVKIYAEAFEQEGDTSYSKWEIREGKLYIEDFDTVEFDKSDYWQFEDDVLVLHESDGSIDKEASVYMYRLD